MHEWPLIMISAVILRALAVLMYGTCPFSRTPDSLEWRGDGVFRSLAHQCTYLTGVAACLTI